MSAAAPPRQRAGEFTGLRWRFRPASGGDLNRPQVAISAGPCSRRDIRGLKRDRYEIQAIETWNLDEGDLTTIIWERDDGPDAITEAEIPF